MYNKNMARQSSTPFFERKEISEEDIERSAHFTYRDGFRLGFGIFIGMSAAGMIFLGLAWLFSVILKLF